MSLYNDTHTLSKKKKEWYNHHHHHHHHHHVDVVIIRKHAAAAAAAAAPPRSSVLFVSPHVERRGFCWKTVYRHSTIMLLLLVLLLLCCLPQSCWSFTLVVPNKITRRRDNTRNKNNIMRLFDTPPEQQEHRHSMDQAEQPPSQQQHTDGCDIFFKPETKNGKSADDDDHDSLISSPNTSNHMNGYRTVVDHGKNNQFHHGGKTVNGKKKQQQQQPTTTTTRRSTSSLSSWASPPTAVQNWTNIMSVGFADHFTKMGKKSKTVVIDSSSSTSLRNGRDKGSLSSPTTLETPSSSSSSMLSNYSNYDVNISVRNDTTTTSSGISSSRVEDMVLSHDDLQEIESYWDRLMPMVSYLGTAQVAKVYEALCVAFRAHIDQRRKSGEPFIIHPVEVALLLSGLKMDGETVMAGLLHDTVEDTDLTFDDVDRLFGPTVRKIVEGETKVSKLPKLAFSDYADEQAENLRQMFVAMSDDYRIIIVKLADRLHNMRTLQHMKPEKQIKISRETLDIFAPLAHRMGIWQFKSELEDTAFMYLYPHEYRRLDVSLQEHKSKYRQTLDMSQQILQRQLDSDVTLAQQASKVEVQGRTKELYSLWHKMETKGEYSLENIGDVVALRVIITPKDHKQQQQQHNQYGSDFSSSYSNNIDQEAPESSPSTEDEERNKTDRGVWLCYHVLGLVQHLPGFQPVPTRVKDYISFPKPNAYQSYVFTSLFVLCMTFFKLFQLVTHIFSFFLFSIRSLHTALMLNGQTIEVQIRTSTMHQVAEMGMASHWAYTDGKRRRSELYNTPWLSSIKEWQNDRISSRDFVDSVRKELLGKRVFVFLRNGKILNLARGATVIDAAFQIHTEVGLNMHGAQINGKPVHFSYELQNGDVVSILTGSQGKPSTEWMRYAKSRSTRSKLRAYFRAKQKESLRQAGTILLLDYLWIHGTLIEKNNRLNQNDFSVPTSLEEVEDFLPGRTQYTAVDDLVVALGKQRDRNLLHTVVSQLFDVSKTCLVEAEKSQSETLFPGSVLNYTQQPHHELPWFTSTNKTPPQSSLGPMYSVESRLFGLNVGFEYADPEHVCEHCLPVLGDEIVGTRPRKNYKAITTVHRVSCPHAQRAVNLAVASRRINSTVTFVRKNDNNGYTYRSLPRVDSVSLRLNRQLHDIANRLKKTGKGSGAMNAFNNIRSDDVPVRLQWSDLDETSYLFLTEIVVYAQDRKLLLADCSEVVSEMAEIQKTQSQTTEENAKLIFLVRVSDLEQLQQLMNRLHQIHSVLSVERVCGTGAELL
jgi:(p)ppGpp synthase/HD superfamily hydrolase